MNAKYESVGRPGHNDDIEELRRHSTSSMTEVDESLLGDRSSSASASGKWKEASNDLDRDLDRQERRRRRSLRASIATWGRWGLDTILLLAILGLLVRQQHMTSSSSSSSSSSSPASSSTAHAAALSNSTTPSGMPESSSSHPYDFGQDFTGVGPRVGQQIVRFKSDQSYAPMNSSEFFTDAVLQKWNKLMPIGMGFVWVNDTHRYHDLPTPIEWPNKTVFTTSVTHQLHCLFTIAQTYSGLASGHPLPPDHHWHMIHCMDYMREAVLCSADMALEGHETTFPDDNGGSDGWDSKHVCKDYSQVKAYLESVRAYDDQLIY